MHILDQEAPGLAKRLGTLAPATQRAILGRASLFTAAKMPDLSTGTSLLLDALRSEGELSNEQAKAALSLSEMADDKYLELQEKGVSDAECGKVFSEARLLRGIAVGFGASAQEDIADAVYELTKALDNPTETIRSIESELKSIT
jgi:hypothetical protein